MYQKKKKEKVQFFSSPSPLSKRETLPLLFPSLLLMVWNDAHKIFSMSVPRFGVQFFVSLFFLICFSFCCCSTFTVSYSLHTGAYLNLLRVSYYTFLFINTGELKLKYNASYEFVHTAHTVASRCAFFRLCL